MNLIPNVDATIIRSAIQSILYCFNSRAQTWWGHPVRPLLRLSPEDGQAIVTFMLGSSSFGYRWHIKEKEREKYYLFVIDIQDIVYYLHFIKEIVFLAVCVIINFRWVCARRGSTGITSSKGIEEGTLLCLQRVTSSKVDSWCWAVPKGQKEVTARICSMP